MQHYHYWSHAYYMRESFTHILFSAFYQHYDITEATLCQSDDTANQWNHLLFLMHFKMSLDLKILHQKLLSMYAPLS